MNGMEMMFRQLLASSGIDLNEQIGKLDALGKLLAEIRDNGNKSLAQQEEILRLLKAGGLEGGERPAVSIETATTSTGENAHG